LRVLLLVENHDLFLPQGVPGRGRATFELALTDLRVAPGDQLRAAAAGWAVAAGRDVREARGEVGRQRLAVVAAVQPT